MFKTAIDWGGCPVGPALHNLGRHDRKLVPWMIWYGSTVAGWTVYWVVGLALADRAINPGYLFPVCFLPPFIGLVVVGGELTGLGQLPALGRWLRSPKGWLAATIITWFVAGLCWLPGTKTGRTIWRGRSRRCRWVGPTEPDWKVPRAAGDPDGSRQPGLVEPDRRNVYKRTL
jgi:hypothetical protein